MTAAVRRATPVDAAGILAVLDAVGAEGRWIAWVPGSRSVAQIAQGLAAGGDQVTWVIDTADGIGGLLEAVRGSAPMLRHVGSFGMAVRREYRRQGFGRALLGAAHRWAAEAGLEKLAIACLASNAPALALYEAAGYVREGVRRGQYRVGGERVDEVLLARWAPF